MTAVEARLKPSTTVLSGVLRPNIVGFLEDYMASNASLYLGLVDGWRDIRALAPHLEAITVSDICRHPWPGVLV